MKKRGLVLVVFWAGVMSFTSYAEMETKEISELFLINGEWKTVAGEAMYQENLPEGWYSENGIWYYIENGSPVSALKNINGKEYLFQPNGMLLSEDSDIYKSYVWLLNEMNQAKGMLDCGWLYDVSTMTEYERLSFLQVYCTKYMYGAEDIGRSGFRFLDNNLSLNPDTDLDLENKIVRFYNEFSGIEQYSEWDRAVYIHNVINRIFDHFCLKSLVHYTGIGWKPAVKEFCMTYTGLPRILVNFRVMCWGCSEKYLINAPKTLKM